MLHYDTVTDQMRTIAATIFSALSPEYYLAGGTSLALQIGHRKSVDLDYFIAQNIDTIALRQQLGEVFRAHDLVITFEEKNTLWCIIDGVKVSFISRFESFLDQPMVVDNFRLASVKDVTVMKLSAICGREEYKDYFDLACLTKDVDASEWVALWQKIYPHVDPTSWIIALSAVDTVTPIPLDVTSGFAALDVSGTIGRVVTLITRDISR